MCVCACMHASLCVHDFVCARVCVCVCLCLCVGEVIFIKGSTVYNNNNNNIELFKQQEGTSHK